MSDPVQHPDFTRALDLLDKGDPSLMLTVALRARRRAEHGSYCECSTPLLDDAALMCRVCLHNNRDQEIRKRESPLFLSAQPMSPTMRQAVAEAKQRPPARHFEPSTLLEDGRHFEWWDEDGETDE